MFDGIERILQEVRYVHDLKRNLISLDMLDQIGYSSFKGDKRLYGDHEGCQN